MICIIFSGHYTGKQLLSETLNQLHIILWDTAAKHYEVWDQVVLLLFVLVKMKIWFSWPLWYVYFWLELKVLLRSLFQLELVLLSSQYVLFPTKISDFM